MSTRTGNGAAGFAVFEDHVAAVLFRVQLQLGTLGLHEQGIGKGVPDILQDVVVVRFADRVRLGGYVDDIEIPVVFEPVADNPDDVGQVQPRFESVELHDHRIGDKVPLRPSQQGSEV